MMPAPHTGPGYPPALGISAPGAGAVPGAALGTVLRTGALWSGGMGCALALHAGVAWWALSSRAETPPPAPPPGAIAFALEPLPAVPEAAAAAPEAAPREDEPDAIRPQDPAPEPAPPVEDKVTIPETPSDLADAMPMPRPRPADLVPPPAASRRAAQADAPGGAAAPQHGAGQSRPEIAPQRFEARLVAHLERHKVYSRAARQRGEQGVVRVAFTLDRTGVVTGARVVRSSGSAALDRDALETLRRASPVPAPPAELREMTFTMPLTFDLR